MHGHIWRNWNIFVFCWLKLHVKRGGVIGGPLPAFHRKFHVFLAFRSFFSVFRHFSLSSGCFPFFYRSFSKQLSVLQSSQKYFSVFRRYFKVFRFSVTQKCHYLVSVTLLLSDFLQEFLLFQFSATFFVLFCLSAINITPLCRPCMRERGQYVTRKTR